jgi:DNA repair ATPase RecN
MKLIKVEMYGFKSFAARAEFVIGEGITGIVGANGGGKSNLVDAIQWALGEEPPTRLRSSGMEDFVFRGDAASVTHVEVSLTFDNSDQRLPHPAPEVKITRRLQRGAGESEYLINDQTARPKAVRDLFLDTGLGVGGFSFMAQGQIDAILRASPPERRVLFEEAAGTSRYRVRRQEAARRIRRIEQDIKRGDALAMKLTRDLLDLEIKQVDEERWNAATNQLRAALAVRFVRHRREFESQRSALAALIGRETKRGSRDSTPSAPSEANAVRSLEEAQRLRIELLENWVAEEFLVSPDELERRVTAVQNGHAKRLLLPLPSMIPLPSANVLASNEHGIEIDSHLFEDPLGMLDQRIAKLRADLAQTHPPTRGVIDRLRVNHQRRNLFRRNLGDLRRAHEQLRNIISELDRKCEVRFGKTFDEVRDHFRQLFRRLFGGGRADLQLVEGDEPGELGVDIVAAPPGRDPRSLALLSGGERALTAVALLFALFSTRPSPFCVLDEVDAALDEANVERYTLMVRDFVKTTQFLIVTHNKRVMSACDMLYGVALESSGASRIITIRSERADALEPTAATPVHSSVGQRVATAAAIEVTGRNDAPVPSAGAGVGRESANPKGRGAHKRGKPSGEPPAPPRGPPRDSATQPAGSLDDRAMNVWTEEMRGKPRTPLAAETRYTAAFNVGDLVDGNLIDEAARIVPLTDIPPEGLATNWVVSSSTVRMEAHSDEKDVALEYIAGEEGARDCWTARFEMLIPREGDSPIRRVRIVRTSDQAADLQIVVMTAAIDAGPHARAPEIYREIHVDLDTGKSSQFRHTPAAHLELRPQRESFTPSETLSVRFVPPYAYVEGTSGGKQVNSTVLWSPSDAELQKLIGDVRAALESLRVAHQDYFNAIDEKDLVARWINSISPPEWWLPRGRPTKEDLDRWKVVETSRELWEVAKRGFKLHQQLFPANSKLRGWIDSLRPGARLNLYYMKGAMPWISHVPWALCFGSDPPDCGNPIDAAAFLGLKLRLSYVAHPIEGSKALGDRKSATLASVLYWGEGAGDETAAEARRQRASLPNDWGRSPVSVPRKATGRKADVLAYLRSPDPSPVALLYLFCQCKALPGADPSLRFDATPEPENVVDTLDLPLDALADQPLVFLNACDTAAADPYSVNPLEQVFFDRGCRAFIGSECKVPIQLAGRFATLFLRTLCDTSAASAGESFAQARRFLWDEYRNLGGLFYTYVNQYELFLGTDTEVASLRAL